MAADSNVLHDADLVQVIDETDDLVQVLGVVPSEDNGEIAVQSVEMDEGASVFIDVDEDNPEVESPEITETGEDHFDDSPDVDNPID
jgi:hypothetical protein